MTTRPHSSFKIVFILGLLLNIISDISYTLVDPRIDFEGR